jgi:hypothetical protein
MDLKCATTNGVSFILVLLRGRERTMDLKCATTNSVSFVLVLLVARSQRQLVDEVQRHCHLLRLHALAVPVPLVVLSDLPDIVLRSHVSGDFHSGTPALLAGAHGILQHKCLVVVTHLPHRQATPTTLCQA